MWRNTCQGLQPSTRAASMGSRGSAISPLLRAADRSCGVLAPRGEVVTYPVGHFAVYEDPVRSRVLEWPYVEGLRMDEAMHPLAILAVGLYGKTLMNQNGAPIRLEDSGKLMALAAFPNLGLAWSDPSDKRNRESLTQEGIIVVSPYNAQVVTVRRRLDAAGLKRLVYLSSASVHACLRLPASPRASAT